MKYGIFAIFCISVMLLSTGQTSGATAKFYDAEMNYDERLKSVLIEQNLGNVSQPLKTTISEWERDMGSTMPNGTFWGTYFTGSKFRNFYTPIWEETEYPIVDVVNYTGTFSYMMLATHFNWSSRIIMNGVSEWWVRLPIAPQCIEATGGLVLGVFEGADNASAAYLETDYYANAAKPRSELYVPEWRMRPTINGYIPDDYILYEFKQNETERGMAAFKPFLWDPAMKFDVGVGVMKNDRIYLKVNSILKSNTDYVITVTFRLIRNVNTQVKFSSIYTYWAGPDNMGKWSHIEFSEFTITHDLAISDNGFQVYTWHVEQIANKSVDNRLDLDWSFIFTEGLGADGLFGKKISFSSNATLHLFPYLNVSRVDTMFMSFMFPFIAEGNFTIEPNILQARVEISWVDEIGKAIEYKFHHWNFTNDLTEFDPETSVGGPPIYYNYSDFVLFSSNSTINWDEFNISDMWNVRVLLNFLGKTQYLNVSRDYELTMLCYPRERIPTLWSSINESIAWNTSYFPWARPFLRSFETIHNDIYYKYYSKYDTKISTYVDSWGNEHAIREKEYPSTLAGTDGIYAVPFQDAATQRPLFDEYFYYEIYCSGRGTDDQWAMYLGTFSGKKLYTYHFPQIIWINPMTWKLNAKGGEYVINMTEKDGYYQRVQDWWGEYYYGDQLRTIWYDPVRQGLIGQVTDGISDVLDAFRQIGEWLYVIGTAFIGQLIEFIQEALDALVALILSVTPLVAPLIFVAVVTLAARSAKNPMEEDDQ